MCRTQCKALRFFFQSNKIMKTWLMCFFFFFFFFLFWGGGGGGKGWSLKSKDRRLPVQIYCYYSCSHIFGLSLHHHCHPHHHYPSITLVIIIFNESYHNYNSYHNSHHCDHDCYYNLLCCYHYCCNVLLLLGSRFWPFAVIQLIQPVI